MNSKVSYIPLKLLAKKIFTGLSIYSVSKFTKDINGIPLLNIRNVVNDSIVDSDLHRIALSGFKNTDQYFVYPGDILLTCRGTQLKIAVVPEIFEKVLITSNFIAIRFNDQVLPQFVAAYFRAKIGQQLILSNATSSELQIVLRVKDLVNINIPVPPLETQHKIVEISRLSEEQYRLGLEIINLKKNITDRVISDTLNYREE